MNNYVVPKSNRKQYDAVEGILLTIALLMLLLLAVFAGYTTYQRLSIIQDDIDNNAISIPVERVASDPDSAVATEEVVNAAVILERAQDATDSVNLLLSFLEGASVLIAVGLGAAAFYGIRQSNQLRTELIDEYNIMRDQIAQQQADDRQKLEDKLAELEEQRAELEKIFDLIMEYEPKLRMLESLQELRQELNNTSDDLKQTIDNVSMLLQADQEFRLRNHREAYRFIRKVLEHDPDNPLALYMAGWLETHFISGEEEQGIRHLEELLRIAPNWPSANAVYGVALRRKGMRSTSIDEDTLRKAEGYLLIALGENPRLVDYNQESYWGPLGGLRRDMGRLDEAIEAYRNALRVTPGSSYPQGNLATLLLQKAQQDHNREAEALEAFQETIKLAQGELGSKPNDYFLLMDLAQSYTILGRVSRKNFEMAESYLTRALDLVDSVDLLNVSLRGWQKLNLFTPRRVEWNETRAAIQDAIQRIQEKGEALEKQHTHHASGS